jgi:hypothetical protein
MKITLAFSALIALAATAASAAPSASVISVPHAASLSAVPSNSTIRCQNATISETYLVTWKSLNVHSVQETKGPQYLFLFNLLGLLLTALMLRYIIYARRSSRNRRTLRAIHIHLNSSLATGTVWSCRSKPPRAQRKMTGVRPESRLTDYGRSIMPETSANTLLWPLKEIRIVGIGSIHMLWLTVLDGGSTGHALNGINALWKRYPATFKLALIEVELLQGVFILIAHLCIYSLQNKIKTRLP